MNMLTRDPWNLIDQWRQELDKAVNAGNPRDDTSRVVGSDWTPAVDIKEEDKQFVLYADIPGVSTDDIEITLDNGILTIRGERRHESTASEEGYKRVERQHGVFIRRFSLPESVDAEGVTASGSDGVLKVVLPKAAPTQSRRIEVK